MLQSAVNEYDDEVRKPGANPELRKLSGMMMLATSAPVGFGASNIEFVPTRYAYKPLTYAFGGQWPRFSLLKLTKLFWFAMPRYC